MKNRRIIFWLTTAIILVALAHVLLSYKGGVAAKLVQRQSLAGETFASPSRITVARPGETAITLEHSQRWRLTSPYSASADESAVMRLVDAVCSAQIEETISDQDLLRLGRSRREYALDEESATTVKLEASGSVATILLGVPTPSGGGAYAAVEGEDAVYVVSSNVLAAANLPAEGFRQRLLFPDWPGSVVSFGVKRMQGQFARFARDADEWKMREPAEGAANAQKIKEYLEALSGAKAVDFVWPSGAKGETALATASLLAGYGLDAESAVTLTLKCADGTDKQISFGKNAKENLVYVLMDNAQTIATVAGDIKDLTLAAGTSFSDSRLFPFESKQVTRFSVSDADATYLVSRGADGAWRLDSPVAACADAKVAGELLARILSLGSNDLREDVRETASAKADMLEVAVFATLGQRHLERRKEKLSRSSVLGGIELKDLRSREMMRTAPSTIKRIVATRRGSAKPTSVVFDRDRRAWSVEQGGNGGIVDTAAVAALAKALDPLMALRIVALKANAEELAGYGLAEPRLIVAIDQSLDDSVRRNILIGDETEGGAYATIGAADAVFVLPQNEIGVLGAALVKEGTPES